MRRRIGSPALSLQRHSIPRLVIDGALVALAYLLAFELRFDNGPTGRYEKLFERTVWWVLAGSFVVLLLSRVYQRRWRYSGQRDYEAVARAVIAIVLLTVVAIAVVHPVQIPHYDSSGRRSPTGSVAVGLPNGVIALFFLLSLLFLIGVRVIARSLHERRPLGGFRAGSRSERNVLIVGAGDGGRLVLREILRNRELGLQPVIAGRYRHGYELVDGHWRVTSMHIMIDLMGDLGHHMLFDLAP